MAKRKAPAEASTVMPRRRKAALGAAAARLQRWARTWLATSMLEDPITQERPAARRRFLLVEPNGVTYAFDAVVLAQSYVTGASFEHPVTRRGLVAPELRRLQRVLFRSDRADLGRLLGLTHLFAPDLRRFLKERDDLPAYLHAVAAECLDGALSLGEELADEWDLQHVEVALYAYEEAVAQVFLRARSTLRELLRLHDTLLERRLERLDPVVIDLARAVLLRLHRTFGAKAPERRSEQVPALADWIAHRG